MQSDIPQILRQDVRDSEADKGGEAACWAHLVCPECGAMESEGHRPGCAQATSAAG